MNWIIEKIGYQRYRRMTDPFFSSEFALVATVIGLVLVGFALGFAVGIAS